MQTEVPEKTESKEFIALLKSNTTDSFKILVETSRDVVYNLCLNYLQNIEEAEDTMQEVYVTIYQTIKNFRGKSSLKTYIYRITINKCLDKIRKKKAKKRFGIFTSYYEDLKPDFNHPGVIQENKQRAEILYRYINKLPSSQKTAFILSETESMTYREIAEIMEITTGAVESLIFRAKKNLRKMLIKYYKTQQI